MFHRFLCFFGIIVCGYGFPQTAAAQLVIFNAGSSAQPGEAVSLQGNFGEQAQVYLVQSTSTTAISLSALIQSAGQATVRIPEKLGLDLYQIWIEDQGQRSPRVYVNLPLGMHFDSPEVTPGGNLRIFGRNLQVRNNDARVRFVAQDGTYAGEGVINSSKSDAYSLSLKTPNTLQPGITYNVYVSNGLGGNEGETKVERTVLSIVQGVDYFRLGVPWAAGLNFYTNVYNVKTDSRLSLKAVGNGQVNDQPAIQKAIDRASADGGGIVYLPAGTYKLSYDGFAGLTMRNRVVIQGAGKDQTIIRFGYDTKHVQMGVDWPSVTSQAGLADLSMINVDNTGQWMDNMTGKGREIFLQRVRFDLNRGDWIWWADSEKLLIANSDLTQGVDSRTNYHGPLQLNGCSEFIIADNTITYAVDGINLNFARNGVFENNRVRRDGSARYPNEVTNHVLIFNFAQNIALLNNTLQVINGPAQDKNDGEAIIAEGGGPDRIDEQTGTTTAATPTTLQDNTKTWNSFRLRPVVAIVSGKGMGQWRTITRGQGNTLTLDRAWDVVPAAGSRYAIFNWGSQNWIVQGNRLEGNRRGVTLYHNATHQVAIVGNTLTNSGSIDLTPVQHIYSDDNTQRFLPMYNNQIIGNSVANTSGANGVFIGVHTVQAIQSNVFGTSVIGLEVRNNTLTAGRPNTPAVIDAVFPEGYLNYVQFQPLNTYYVAEQIPAILGSIFENNTAINCDNALYLNSGSYNTLVCNTRLLNSTNLINDNQLERVDHASIKTTFCLTNPLDPASAVLKIYPNPVTDELHVQLAAPGARLMVYSVTGALLINTHTATTEAILDVQHLPAGTYFLLVQPDQGKQIGQSFIKHKS